MKNPGLVYCVVSAVGIDNRISKGKYTPDRSLPLVNNEDGVPVSGIFNYNSSV